MGAKASTSSAQVMLLSDRRPSHVIFKHSGRCIYDYEYPKFHLECFKSRSFVQNRSKISNYLMQQDIPYTGIV
jgi:hypothetical protein